MITALTIQLDRIGPGGHEIDESLEAVWLAEALGPDAPFQPLEAGHLTAHLERIEAAVRVKGRVQVRVSGSCARCLEPAELDLDSKIDLTLFPAGREPSALGDGEISDAGMGVATYRGETIDLREVVRDEVFLSLPMNPLCARDCAGLCGACGANLNQGSCGCARQLSLV